MFAVEGTLKAILISGSSGGNRCTIATKIESSVILEDGHYFEGEIVADTVYTSQGDQEMTPGIGTLDEDLDVLFLPEFLEDNGYAKYVLTPKLIAAILDGRKWKAE